MTDFSLFEEMFDEIHSSGDTDDDECSYVECSHVETINDGGQEVCISCGKEVDNIITHAKDWRYYGNSDNKHAKDPTRVQLRRVDERSIYNDLSTMNFSSSIINCANDLYKEATDGRIFRGNSRKSIISACVFYAYQVSGKSQTHDKLLKIFQINKKSGLKGLKHVSLNVSKKSITPLTNNEPDPILEDIMAQFDATDKQKEEVYDIFNSVQNKSRKLNRSKPQSTASGIVYYWITKNNINITLKEFSKIVKLSELTITKLSKEVEGVMKKIKEKDSLKK